MTVRSLDFSGDIPNITVSEQGLVQVWHPENHETLLAELGNVQAREYAYQLLAASEASHNLLLRKYS